MIKDPIKDLQHNVKDQIESKNRCRIHIHASSDRKSTTFKKFTTHTRVFAHRITIWWHERENANDNSKTT